MDWNKLSFAEQVGHIGSEISRARYWEVKGDMESRDKSLERTLGLVDLTLANNIGFSSRLKEVARLREMIADLLAGSRSYSQSLALAEGFCLNFAILARL